MIDSLISQKRISMLIDFAAELSFFSDKSVVITGGTGFVGSAIVRRLVSIAKEVHIIARVSSSTERIQSILTDVHLHRIVLDSHMPLAGQMPEVNPDIIIHAAQPSIYGLKSAHDFVNIQHISACMTTNTLEYAHTKKVERMIHIGSSAVYGNNKLDSFKESDPFQPDTARGLIKLTERNLCHYYARAYGVPVNIARVSRAYGPYDAPNKLIIQALKRYNQGESIDLVADNIVRDYIHVDDIVLCIAKMCETSLTSGDEFNVAGGKAYNAREIVSYLEELLNTQGLISRNTYPLSGIDKTFKRADISKAKALLKWEPQIDIKDGLQDVITWYQSYSSQ